MNVKSILVVEDEERDADALQRYLYEYFENSFPVVIDMAASRSSAFALLRTRGRHPYDAVILDHQIPDEDFGPPIKNLRVAKEIVRHPDWTKLVIQFSAHAGDPELVDFWNHHAMARIPGKLIDKGNPRSSQEIAERIRASFGQPEAVTSTEAGSRILILCESSSSHLALSSLINSAISPYFPISQIDSVGTLEELRRNLSAARTTEAYDAAVLDSASPEFVHTVLEVPDACRHIVQLCAQPDASQQQEFLTQVSDSTIAGIIINKTESDWEKRFTDNIMRSMGQREFREPMQSLPFMVAAGLSPSVVERDNSDIGHFSLTEFSSRLRTAWPVLDDETKRVARECLDIRFESDSAERPSYIGIKPWGSRFPAG